MIPRNPLSYHEWIENEADLIHADGCTGVTNVNGWPCLQHDLEFKTGRSAAAAYNYYRWGHEDYWAKAPQITFEIANAHFRAALFRESALGYLNVFSWARYVAMRLKKTRAAWNGHRERESLGIGA